MDCSAFHEVPQSRVVSTLTDPAKPVNSGKIPLSDGFLAGYARRAMFTFR
jgi:hypothetical protein